jgi:hypothetical protein
MGLRDGGAGSDLGAEQRDGVLDLVRVVAAEHVVQSCCVRDPDQVALLAQLEKWVEERCEFGRFGLVEPLPAGSANGFAVRRVSQRVRVLLSTSTD